VPSKVEALVRNFLRTDADALYLVPGERMYLMRGNARTVVGREGLSEDSFRAVAGELVPGGPVETLTQLRHRMTFRTDETQPLVDIQFDRLGNQPAIVITRAKPEEPAPAPRVFALPPPAPPPPATAAPEPIAPPPELTAAATPPPIHLSQQLAAIKVKPAKLIDELLQRMLEFAASDFHLTSAQRPVFRVHGEVTPQMDWPIFTPEDVERALSMIMPERNRKEFTERNDTDFAYEIPEVARFRVNVFRDRMGMGAVFRHIPFEILTVEQLGLSPAVVGLCELPKGLVLVTGPTGSGKSTTLAALINHINETRTDHIITIEDPIEFVHPNKRCLINQREINTHTRGFKEALRAALREDPDIVLVGEMRDLETIAIAIETAETGHLVFGTLHTTTAMSTMDRIVDQFPADRQQQIRVMLADSVRGVVCQTLLKRVGGGRVAAMEILLASNAVCNLIRDGKTFQLPSVLQTSRQQGMVLLNDALLELVKRGLVEPREAWMKTSDKAGLAGLYKSHGIAVPT